MAQKVYYALIILILPSLMGPLERCEQEKTNFIMGIENIASTENLKTFINMEG